jgi:ketosteroid isomerase-like protein
MAFDRANFTLTATPKAGGQAAVSSGQFLEVLRKENGKWKSLRAMNTLDKQYGT